MDSSLSDKKRPLDHPSSPPPSKKSKFSNYYYLTIHIKLEGSSAERYIVIGTHENFSCFAEGIIQSFGYDINRIYSFHLDGEPFSPSGPTYYSPLAQKSPSSNDVLLAEIEWTENQSLLLLYDYAECHNFTITIKKIEIKEELLEIYVLHDKSKGNPPPQLIVTSDDEFDVNDTDDSSSEQISLSDDSED